MTVGIVHLSDMHISKRNTILVENKGVIANTIYNNSVEYSNVIILVSGDTAFSGNAEEYALASELFTEIKNRFLETNKKVDFLICPGNHDCNFSKNSKMRELIIESGTSDFDDEMIDTLTKIQSEFNEFANSFGNSEYKKILDSNLLKVLRTEIDGKEHNFFLYNSAFASELKEEMGKLKLPHQYWDKTIEELNSKADAVNVAIMHHPFHWFNNLNYNEIEQFFMSNFNFVFLGHEHYEEHYDKINDRGSCSIMKASEFSNDNHIGGFSIYSFDYANNDRKCINLFWNGNGFNSKESNKNLPVLAKHSIVLQEQLLADLDAVEILSNHNDIKLSDIYIAPYIRKVNGKSTTKISANEVIDNKDNRYWFVTGDNRTGKTSLLKMIFNSRYQKMMYPVMLDASNINMSYIKNYSKAVKKMYGECYAKLDSCIIDTISKDKKILLIDNIERCNFKLKETIEFLNNIKNYFSEIVITVSNDYDLTLLSQVDNKVDNIYETYELLPFNKEQRLDLYEKWLKKRYNGECDINRVEYLERFIDNHFKSGIVPATPFYLLSTVYLLDNRENSGMSGISDISNYLNFYKLIIETSLLNAGLESKKLQYADSYLRQLAYEFYISDYKIITKDGLEEFNVKYKKDKNITTISVTLDMLLKANILKKVDDSYKFSFEYLYYFYMASYIANDLEVADQDIILKDMIADLSNIEKVNIIIFFAYYCRDKHFRDIIIDKAKQVVASFDDVEDMDVFNNTKFIDGFISEIPNYVIPKKKGFELKKIEAQNSDKNEQQSDLSDEQATKEADIYLESFKMIEIIGNLLINYDEDLPGNVKKELCEYIYILHNKVINHFMNRLKQFTQFLNSALDEKLKEEKFSNMNKEKVIKELQKFIFYLVSRLYRGASFYIVRKSSSLNLLPTHKDILDIKQDTFIKVVYFINKLEYEKEFPMALFLEVKETLYNKRNIVFEDVFKQIIIRHLFIRYYDIGSRKVDEILNKLGISTQGQQELKVKLLVSANKH